MKLRSLLVVLALLVVGGTVGGSEPGRAFNGPYSGPQLNRVAFPIGGIGAGMFCLEGSGALSHVSIFHQMDFFNEPTVFAAVCVLGKTEQENVARVVEGPIPDWKYFGRPGTGNGGTGTTYGLPRFDRAEFLARFPFATLKLSDPALPLEVELTGWSPFTPPDADPSSLPVGALEYTFHNRTPQAVNAVFSFHSRNFLAKAPAGGAVTAIPGGFVLQTPADEKDRPGGLAFFVDGRQAVVDHCWFRGGWWDALTIAWSNVQRGLLLENPVAQGSAPGASLYVPLAIDAGGSQTVRLLVCWYVPQSKIRVGAAAGKGGAAFRGAPSHGTAKSGQQPVAGFLGRGLVNTFDPDGDAAQGTLTSPEFTLNKRYLHFLVGGGDHATQTCVNLLVGGKVIHSETGRRTEKLEWATFDLASLAGQRGQIQIVDRHSGPWGHILADHFVLSDEPLAALKEGDLPTITADPGRVSVIQDFEGSDYGNWVAASDGAAKAQSAAPCACAGGQCCPEETPSTYTAWYTRKFAGLPELAQFWRTNYDNLRKRSAAFRDAFYDSTVPPEVIEAVAANLTILKTPTVLRQHDGRLWCWEGCGDSSGCCAGSCTHVWNYAQAICHLFPSLERSLRQTEFHEAQDDAGRQAFRANLPITPGGVGFDASDGQLGGIMKAYREWRIAGDRQWLAAYWPRIKQSLDHCIAKYDPRHTGLLEEEHHNTYDINYFGPNGHCGSFYLGALAAAAKMGEALGEDTVLYRELLAKGGKRLEAELFNGEYFIQIVQKEGLDRNFKPIPPEQQSAGYRAIAEAVNRQGPKYQYGTGCLSDGVLGLWMARACGIDDDLVAPAQVRSHLLAVYKHNLKHDLAQHSNPQRPTYAMGHEGGLLLCSWPRGDKPLLPFVYSDEVWTGIEYQVASHLMLIGCVPEGLDIVRTCRLRYDGVRRNPFNEYECGHWYARAMSSYGLLQGLTGAWYDPATQTLTVKSRVGDFRSFLATAGGFGTVVYKAGKATLEVRGGSIPVEKVVVRP